MDLIGCREAPTMSKSTTKLALSLALSALLILLYYYSLKNSSNIFFTNYQQNPASATESTEKCDIFTGEWVPNPEAPYYTNTTCSAIHEHQNCIKYGRPDSDFLKWKWKPNDCELQSFDPAEFLEVVRDKSLAFVGDSVARNQMQSLICLLSEVEYPTDASYIQDDYFRRWKYKYYNFTLATFWSPYLINSTMIDPKQPRGNGLFNLYLDEFDESWTNHIDEFDYIIISSGHWFFRSLMYYENHSLIGCNSCDQKNVTEYPKAYGYRRAFRTAFKAILGREKLKGTIFLRTFAPSHFEGGDWNTGGDCVKTMPSRSNETMLKVVHKELYDAQVEEFRMAKREGKKRGLNFEMFDVTKVMLLRGDGHPSRYGHWPHEKVVMYNDCVHWCLPGPIDSWNDLLLELLKADAWV